MWLSARDLDVPGLRLFCLPHAGSGAAGFYRWKRLLPGTIAVCPVLLPGREVRLAEAPLTETAAVADRLHEHARGCLDRPYAIFGHSMGALLAFEWALRIADAGLGAPRCLFVSGRNAPQVEPPHTHLHRLEPEPFVRELKARYNGEPDAVLADPELRALFLPILRSDLQMVETYSPRRGAELSCRVSAFSGEDDRSVSGNGIARWSEVTTGAFTSRRFPGDHFYHFGSGQAELLRVIAQTLEPMSSEAPSANPAAG